MDFLLDDDQKQIAAAVTDVATQKFPLQRLQGKASGCEVLGASDWKELAALGWFGLGLDEAAGGVGFALTEEILLFREIGRHLVSPNILATVLAARVAFAAGHANLSAAIAAGEHRVSFGVARSGMTLRPRVTGDIYVLDALDSRYLLLLDNARAVLLDRAGLTQLRKVVGMDGLVAMETVSLSNADTVAVTDVHSDAIAGRACVLVAAQLVGIAEAVRDMAVDYAKTREQFGQPIGAFQAIKHRCADFAVAAEAAWCQTIMAAISVRDGRPDAAMQAAAARLLARRAALENAAANIQVHGAMGFTEECDAHRFLKRAHLLDHIGSNERDRRTMLLEAAPC